MPCIDHQSSEAVFTWLHIADRRHQSGTEDFATPKSTNPTPEHRCILTAPWHGVAAGRTTSRRTPDGANGKPWKKVGKGLVLENSG